MQKYPLFGYNPNIFNYFFEVFWKRKDKPLKHNEVTGRFFLRMDGAGKKAGREGTLLYSCVRMCAREGEKEGSGQGGYTQKFFALPSITYHPQS